MRSLWQRWRHVPWGWRWAIWVVLVVGGFYTVENIRGAYAMRVYEQRCLEAGEWLVRPGPPEEGQNLPDLLAAAGIDDSKQLEVQGFNFNNARFRYGPSLDRCLPFEKYITEEGEWDQASAARRYLERISETRLKAYVAAAQEADYIYHEADENGVVQFVRLYSRGIQLLCWRASAYLAVGQSNAAIKDLRLVLMVAKMAKADGYMNDQLVSNGVNAIVAAIVWEGLQSNEPAWQTDEIRGLLTQLSTLPVSNQLPDWVFCNDRSVNWQMREQITTLSGRLSDDSFFSYESIVPPLGLWTDAEEAINKGALFLPNGWFKLWWIRSQENMRVINWPHLPRLDSNWNFTIWQMVDDPMLWTFDASWAIRRWQATQRAVVIALALECYRSEKGRYPAKLSQLAPTYLSAEQLIDPYASGAEFRYLAPETPQDRPLFYSLWINEKDDGATRSAGTRDGDLVWSYQLADDPAVEN